MATVPKPEIKRQAGTPTQLPQGQAQVATEAIRAAEQAQAAQASPAETPNPAPEAPQTAPQAQEPTPPTQMAPGASQGPNPMAVTPPAFKPSTDEERFLFGPTERPNEPIEAGIHQGRRIAPPSDIADSLPALAYVANRPDAPPQLRVLLDLISYHLGG